MLRSTVHTEALQELYEVMPNMHALGVAVVNDFLTPEGIECITERPLPSSNDKVLLLSKLFSWLSVLGTPVAVPKPSAEVSVLNNAEVNNMRAHAMHVDKNDTNSFLLNVTAPVNPDTQEPLYTYEVSHGTKGLLQIPLPPNNLTILNGFQTFNGKSWETLPHRVNVQGEQVDRRFRVMFLFER